MSKKRDTIDYSIEPSFGYGWTIILHYDGRAFPAGFAFTFNGAHKIGAKRVEGFKKYLKKHELWEA